MIQSLWVKLQRLFGFGIDVAKQKVAESSDRIIVQDGIQGQRLAILFIILFATMLVYILKTSGYSRREREKMEQAQKLIREGHEKAMHGSAFDGMYREIKTEIGSQDNTKNIKEDDA